MAAETGNTYISETMRHNVEISTANPAFSIMSSSRKCRLRVISTTNDNRKWQCSGQNRKYLYLWNRDIYDGNSKGKSGALRPHAKKRETVVGRLRRRTTGNGNMDVLDAILSFPAIRRCRNHFTTILSRSTWRC